MVSITAEVGGRVTHSYANEEWARLTKNERAELIAKCQAAARELAKCHIHVTETK